MSLVDRIKAFHTEMMLRQDERIKPAATFPLNPTDNSRIEPPGRVLSLLGSKDDTDPINTGCCPTKQPSPPGLTPSTVRLIFTDASPTIDPSPADPISFTPDFNKVTPEIFSPLLDPDGPDPEVDRLTTPNLPPRKSFAYARRRSEGREQGSLRRRAREVKEVWRKREQEEGAGAQAWKKREKNEDKSVTSACTDTLFNKVESNVNSGSSATAAPPILNTVEVSLTTKVVQPLDTTETDQPLDAVTIQPTPETTVEPLPTDGAKTQERNSLPTSDVQPISTESLQPLPATSAPTLPLPNITIQPIPLPLPLPTATIQPISQPLIPTTTVVEPITTTTSIQPLQTTTSIQPQFNQTTVVKPLQTTSLQPLQTTTVKPPQTTNDQPLPTTIVQPLHTTIVQPLKTTSQIPTTTPLPDPTTTALPDPTTTALPPAPLFTPLTKPKKIIRLKDRLLAHEDEKLRKLLAVKKVKKRKRSGSGSGSGGGSGVVTVFLRDLRMRRFSPKLADIIEEEDEDEEEESEEEENFGGEEMHIEFEEDSPGAEESKPIPRTPSTTPDYRTVDLSTVEPLSGPLYTPFEETEIEADLSGDFMTELRKASLPRSSVVDQNLDPRVLVNNRQSMRRAREHLKLRIESEARKKGRPGKKIRQRVKSGVQITVQRMAGSRSRQVSGGLFSEGLIDKTREHMRGSLSGFSGAS